jgi:hypothetical protein
MEADEEIKGRAEETRSSAVGMRLRGNKSKRQEQDKQERAESEILLCRTAVT